MATYSVTFSENDDWGQAEFRFKYRWQADEVLEKVKAENKFARIVKWEDGHPKEMARVEPNQGDSP
jgi:thymidine phosphorylase